MNAIGKYVSFSEYFKGYKIYENKWINKTSLNVISTHFI